MPMPIDLFKLVYETVLKKHSMLPRLRMMRGEKTPRNSDLERTAHYKAGLGREPN